MIVVIQKAPLAGIVITLGDLREREQIGELLAGGRRRANLDALPGPSSSPNDNADVDRQQ